MSLSNLFLVRSRVRVRGYMSDREEVSDEIDLVIAEDASTASQKVEAHYDEKSSDYGTSYTCNVEDVRSAIV